MQVTIHASLRAPGKSEADEAMKKDIHKLIKLARQQGWTVDQGRNSHYKLTPPDKSKRSVVLPHSPGGNDKMLLKYKRLLRGSGLQIP
jgi:hypothetical protein